MLIIYISDCCSPKKYREIEQSRKRKLLPAQQNFNWALISSLSKINDCRVHCISALPVSSSSHRKRIWSEEREEINSGLTINYISFINTKILRIFSQFYFTRRAIKQIINTQKEDSIIICDTVVPQCVNAVMSVAKKVNIPTIGLVTDIPSYPSKKRLSLRNSLEHALIPFFTKALHNHDGYIVLTKYINNTINEKKRPYTIIEGIVRQDFVPKDGPATKNKNVLYAGGIYEKFGVIKLAEAFSLTKLSDYELHFYGTGDDIEKLKVFEKDERIKYKGVALNSEIVAIEQSAILLVNPRPSDEVFTKYSFPSKTIDYMLSGTPLLSTKLPGIPDEYNEYMFLFEDESIEGMCNQLEKVLSYAPEYLLDFGKKAQNFVLDKKNSSSQAAKVYQLLRNIKGA
jgi:glycosyltransferase involved in cell wall biosynthesis